MNIDRFRRAFWSPLAAIVFEIPYGLFLLGVDRYDRIIRGQEGLGLRINVLKLRVAIDVLAAFSGLAVGLQAIAHVAQKIANNSRANLMSLLRQLLHQITQAARGPQQRLHRAPSRCGQDQTFEIVQKSWILERLLLPPTAALADTSGRRHHMIAKVSKSVINRRSRQSGDPRHQTDAATPQRRQSADGSV